MDSLLRFIYRWQKASTIRARIDLLIDGRDWRDRGMGEFSIRRYRLFTVAAAREIARTWDRPDWEEFYFTLAEDIADGREKCLECLEWDLFNSWMRQLRDANPSHPQERIDAIANCLAPSYVGGTIRMGDLLDKQHTVSSLSIFDDLFHLHFCDTIPHSAFSIEIPHAEDVRSIATQCYNEGRAAKRSVLDNVRLAVLADALEDAGYAPENHNLLEHLRSPAPHYRGCWALDFVLGHWNDTDQETMHHAGDP